MKKHFMYVNLRITYPSRLNTGDGYKETVDHYGFELINKTEKKFEKNLIAMCRKYGNGFDNLVLGDFINEVASLGIICKRYYKGTTFADVPSYDFYVTDGEDLIKRTTLYTVAGFF